LGGQLEQDVPDMGTLRGRKSPSKKRKKINPREAEPSVVESI